MDNPVDNQDRGSPVGAQAPTCRFGPDRRLSAVIGALALVAAAAAALSSDPPGRVLLGAAALVLLGYALTDLVFWPRLTAGANGLLIRTPLTRTRLAWSDIEAVRADARERLGLRSVTLEIDAGEQLVVFSRRALGADPATVAGLIWAFNPGSA
ncbi:MAG: PH domain-containing protein [Jatrophihabitantaceae bacterium]